MLLVWYGVFEFQTKWSKKEDFKPVIVDIEDYDDEQEIIALCAWLLMRKSRRL